MKKSVLSLLFVLALLLSFVPSLLPQTADAATASSVQDAKDKIAEAQEKQKELQKQLDALANKKEAYMDQKEIIEQQVGELAEEISVYDQLISALDGEIALSEAKIAAAQKNYNDNIEKFKAQARATYENGQTSYLEVLLGAESFSDFLLSLDYVEQVSLYERKLLDTITESIRVEREEMAVVAEKRAQVDGARAAAQERKSEVDKKNSELSKVISSLNSNAAALEAAKKEAHKKEEELNEWIEKELAGENSSVDYQEGEWIWPVARASYNYMSSGYGWRTLNGRREFHYAIDIAAPRGTPVLATKAGVIKSAKWVTTGGGWQVVIDHGGTYYSYYNHLNKKPIVTAGQRVSQGEVIGYVGDSGYAFGTHLDFKIYYNAKVQNPANYVKNPY
ncbi:MAG: peptidoglycan DD-metalloendopeptidase family protein [Clostridia bacterium]|nr:peptidoglycan DD-metalloendopeptidase family protein [Clostridia bacterium]